MHLVVQIYIELWMHLGNLESTQEESQEKITDSHFWIF